VSELRIIIDLTFKWNRYVGMPLSSLPGYLPGIHFQGTASDAVDNGKRWTISGGSGGVKTETSFTEPTQLKSVLQEPLTYPLHSGVSKTLMR